MEINPVEIIEQKEKRKRRTKLEMLQEKKTKPKKRGRPKKRRPTKVHGEISTSMCVSDEHGGTIGKPIVKKHTLDAEDIFLDTHSETSLSLGMTKSLGNFEFVKVMVSMKQYCKKGEEQQSLERSEDVCSKYIDKLLKDANKVSFDEIMKGSAPAQPPSPGSFDEDPFGGLE